MRKFLPYILIVIILAGLFSPVVSIQAQEDPDGTCTYTVPKGDRDEIKTYTSKKTECENTTLGTYLRWVENKKAPEPKGTCYKNAGEEIAKDVTQKYCLETLKGETWGGDSPSVPINNQTPEEKYNSCIRDGGSDVDCKNYVKASTKPDTAYHLLEPLPCKGTETEGCVNGRLESFDPGGTGKLGEYLNFAITLFIGLCAVAAVVMIVIGGIEYSASEVISDKSAAKERIKGAIFGLLLALGAYALLYTINPDLLKTDFDIGGATLTSEGEILIRDLIEKIITVGGPITDKNRGSVGTTCDANVIYNAAGGSLTPQEAATFACLITPESGCKSVKNYAWGRGSTAYGFYQILLQSHAQRFEIPACWNAAGVRPISCSRGFRGGSPLNNQYTQQCINAANDFTCSTKVAVSILRTQGFSAWTADKKSAKQRACIARFSR